MWQSHKIWTKDAGLEGTQKQGMDGNSFATKSVTGQTWQSLDEVLGPMQKQIRRGCALAPDGSQAFKAAAAALQKPLLPGVRHGQKLFTPTTKLAASTCQTETKKRTLTKNIAKKSGKDYIMAAGDNCAEGLLGNIKTTLRTGFSSTAVQCRTQTEKVAASFADFYRLRLFLSSCFQEIWWHPRAEGQAFLPSCSQCSGSVATTGLAKSAAGTFGPETCQSSWASGPIKMQDLRLGVQGFRVLALFGLSFLGLRLSGVSSLPDFTSTAAGARGLSTCAGVRSFEAFAHAGFCS